MKPPLPARFYGAAGLSAALIWAGAASLSRADEVPWLADRTVTVAPHRTGLMHPASGHALVGYLARPPGSGRRPAVLELHGCGGFGTEDVVAADVLRSFGYVALALDSLGPLDTCSADTFGEAAEAVDAYTARAWLAKQSFVDPDRIALLGFAMGGSAALDDIEFGWPLEKTHRRQIRAAILFYPNCRYRQGVTSVPALILTGEEDDWAPAAWCREMLAARRDRGAPVTLTVYPGARHAFNVPGELRRKLGHHLAYDPEATEEAWTAVRRFLRERLGGVEDEETLPSPAIRWGR